MSMRYIVLITFALSLLGIPASWSEGSFAAEGVVVAVQKAGYDVRMADPHSMGDMVEVWMVRVDNWARTGKPALILVEYTHGDAVVKDRELDSTVWRFEIRAAPSAESGTCLSWWSAERSFVPTALRGNQKLPPAKQLRCFLMQKRPVALRDAKAPREKPITPTMR
jgi:hypothetical protein